MRRCGTEAKRLRKQQLGCVLVALGLALGSCGSDGPEKGEDYGNLLASPAGLVVVREEHPSGWGRPDCLVCHQVGSMHVVNRTGLPDCDELSAASAEACIDLAEIQSIIRNQGQASCVLCHGPNGVEP